MSIRIYQSTLPSSATSENGEITSPIIFKFTQAGGNEERQLFLRHDVLAGEGAESSTAVIIDPIDLATSSGDQSTWIQVAADVAGSPGTYAAAGASKNLGDVNLGATVPFWIKATVPANTEVGARDDLALNLAATSTNIDRIVDLSAGTYTGCFFDGPNNKIKFEYDDSGDTGQYLSAWIDMSAATEIQEATYTAVGGSPIFSYRTATDSSGTGATAWFFDPTDLDLTKDWFQIRIQFYASTPISISGLTQHKYTGGSTFNTFHSTVYGTIPFSGNPNGGATSAPHTAKWIGYIYIPTTGSYGFRLYSDDGHRLFINGVQVLASSSFTSPGTTSASTTLSAGYHAVEYQWYDGGGGAWIYGYITPPSASERDLVVGDFKDDRYGVANIITISDLRIRYQGAYTTNFDIRFWNGPATPELISPTNGSSTEEFNPLLTAKTTNGDNINFQLDTVNTFDSSNLTSWEAACINDVNCSSQSPTFDRPDGVWYWRARAKLDGDYGNWSDPWVLTILPFTGLNQYLYLNINTGIEVVDTLLTNKHLYLTVNSGYEEISLYVNRHVYLNVYVGYPVGEVIYPIYDRTPVRKQTFTEDSEAFL